MQLTQRITLLCQDGKSDKVYEVDLVQVGVDAAGILLYRVNFRYGKRGKSLREGSETVTAVPEAEARRAFDKLVASKIKKGYRDVTGADVAELTPDKAPITIAAPKTKALDTTGRNQHILDRLRQAAMAGSEVVNPSKKVWPIDRVIWRAGELRLRDAAPLLLPLLTTDPLRRYCVVWALGQCGDRTIVPQLEAMYHDASEPEQVRRIALEAMFKLSEQKAIELRSALTDALPRELKHPLQQGDVDAFAQALQRMFTDGHVLDFVHLDRLYQINDPVMRPVLLEVLRSAPFKPNYFQRLRHIFKAAEYRGDAEVFAILALRFEREDPMYYSGGYYGFYVPDRGYIQARTYDYPTRTWQVNPEYVALQKAADSPIADSDRTHDYFQRRIWRTLKTFGKLEQAEYTQFATAILLTYSDADAEDARESDRQVWNRKTNGYRSIHTRWDRFAACINLNHILYTHSPRYEFKKNSNAWRCKKSYKPGDPVANVREEAFPHLWERDPESLLKLLLESHCEPVHTFATKAIQACTEFCGGLPIDTLLQLLAQPYECTAKLGFALVRDRYDPAQPDLRLVGAIVHCRDAIARAEAYQWIQAQPERFIQDVNFTTELITSSQAETRSFVRTLLGTTRIPIETLNAIMNYVVNAITQLKIGDDEFAAEIVETLSRCFQQTLPTLDLNQAIALLDHPLPDLQRFAAQVILIHRTPVTELPLGIMERLLDSEVEAVRVIGVQLFGALPDDRLSTQLTVLQTFLTHDLEAMREAIRPRIRQLAIDHPSFRQDLVALLLSALQHPEIDPAVQSFLVRLLHQDIPDWMQTASYDQAMSLLHTQATSAQEMAGHLLTVNYQTWIDRFAPADVVLLAKNDVQVVRSVAQSILQRQLPSLRTQPEQLMGLVNLLDSDWEDGRSIGMQLFGDWLTPEELTPAILINICDSNRADVRKFGRDRVMACFQAADGQEYLLKLSEHPASDMQLFATQYLEQYASGQSDRIRELMPYFTRVLGQVNRGRVAKARIFAFLDREATQDPVSAELIADLFAKQSATISITDRAKSIEVLLKIHRQYPHLELPIVVQPVKVLERY
jgi:predicted DNA-binding WGR domain protein